MGDTLIPIRLGLAFFFGIPFGVGKLFKLSRVRPKPIKRPQEKFPISL